MLTLQEAYFIGLCIEGFCYGKICVFTCTTLRLAKEVPCLGFYSGIFAIYLQCPSTKSRTTILVLYALCLLYVLSVATLVCDTVSFILGVSNYYSICKNIIFNQLFSRVSGHSRLNFKLPPNQCCFTFRLFKPQQAGVVISSPNAF